MKRVRAIVSGIALLSLLIHPALAAAQTQDVMYPNPVIEKQLKALQREVSSKGATFKVGYSSAMDRSINELCGLREPAGWMDKAPVERLSATPLAALPSSFDWRTMGGTTPIKNQGSCGSCWAFGTAAPLESQIKLQCGVTVDMAEQYLVSCNRDGWSCSGGWWAHDYHIDKTPPNDAQSGAVAEASFPYKATNAACGGPYERPYRLINWSYVAGYPRPTVQAIKQAIFNYGPVAAAVYVGPKFQAYGSGIFNTSETGTINHAIVLVGWNDDLGTDNGYWILRNSWGTGWGESGYMRIRYNVSQVGYAANYVQFACNDNPLPPNPDPIPDPEPEPTPTPLPNLEGSFTRLTGLRAGAQVTATLRVTNTGTVNAGAFRVLLYHSKNGTDKTQYLGAVNVRSLYANRYRDISIRKRSTTPFLSGEYLMAVIDSESQVKESNENDNLVLGVIP